MRYSVRKPANSPDGTGGQFTKTATPKTPEFAVPSIDEILNKVGWVATEDMLCEAEEHHDKWAQIVDPFVDEHTQSQHYLNYLAAREAVQTKKLLSAEQSTALEIQEAWEDEQEIFGHVKRNRAPEWCEAERSFADAYRDLRAVLRQYLNAEDFMSSSGDQMPEHLEDYNYCDQAAFYEQMVSAWQTQPDHDGPLTSRHLDELADVAGHTPAGVGRWTIRDLRDNCSVNNDQVLVFKQPEHASAFMNALYTHSRQPSPALGTLLKRWRRDYAQQHVRVLSSSVNRFSQAETRLNKISDLKESIGASTLEHYVEVQHRAEASGVKVTKTSRLACHKATEALASISNRVYTRK